MEELSFVRHETHRALLRDTLQRARADHTVSGFMVSGSVARGDALPGSDLDLYVLLQEGSSRPFEARMRGGIPVEVTYRDAPRARSRLERRPMEVYRYLDGRVLYDPAGKRMTIAKLAEHARDVLDAYHTPRQEKEGHHWNTMSANLKMKAAREAGDLLRARFVASTSSWPLMEALSGRRMTSRCPPAARCSPTCET